MEQFRVTSARAIVLMFIDSNAPKQVNLSASVRKEIIKAFQSNDQAALGRRDLFDKALKEMYHDLRQNPSFKSFIVTIFGGVGTGGVL